MRILVIGATGYVGSRLVTALLADGHQVVTASRNRLHFKRFGWHGDITGVTLDVADEAVTLAAFAAAGPVEVVCYLVHGMGRPGFGEADNPVDPISIRDVLYYLLAAADAERVPAGAYYIAGPGTASYGELLQRYSQVAGKWHAGLPVAGVGAAVASRVSAFALPVPDALAGELVESLDHPMLAVGAGLRDLVPDPPGGLLAVDDAIALALSSPPPRPVDTLTDPHHLADSDPVWAGGDMLRIRRLARAVTPCIARPTLELMNASGPVAGALRTGLDMMIALTPKVRPE